jgi:hypothetical protein
MKKIKLLLTFLFVLQISQIALAQKGSRSPDSSREKPLVDIDLGFASGNYNGSTYSEMNLGVNLNFTDWLTWRNSGFKRFASNQQKEITGLDSTMRLISTNKFDGGIFRLFGGAGYRFTDSSDKNALVGEGGVGLQIGRFGLGAGAKYLKYDKIQFDSKGLVTKNDDTVFFIAVSGGAGLSF